MKALFNRAVDYLQSKFPPNRIVVLLTPVLFVPGAAWASAWLGEHLPGVQFAPEVIVGFAAAGALSALTAAYKWLDGWQADEAAFNERFNAERIIEAESKAASK
jgi:hypothetical protein